MVTGQRYMQIPVFLVFHFPLLLLWQRLSCCHGGQIRPVPDLPVVNFSRTGDLNLGVILSLHRYDPTTLCGGVTRELGALQRLESMVFAVEEVNRRSDLLHNITLGFTILDDCFNELTAVTRALHFIQDPATGNSTPTASLPAVDAVAVIGAEGSPRTMELAALFSVFQVPQLSYASSSSLLDDKDKYSYFSRIVPSDNMQVRAIVDILLTFDWTYVSMLYADDSYGSVAFRDIQNLLDSHGHCLAVTGMVNDVFKKENYEATVRKLLRAPHARVVVLFITQQQALHLFRAVARLGQQDHFTWVGSDTLANSLVVFRGLESVVHGSLAVSFVTNPVNAFEERFRKLTLNTGFKDRNPWFGEFFAEALNCSLHNGSVLLPPCKQDVEIGTSADYKPESTASLAMNAVYAWAHALDAVIMNCSQDVIASDVKRCVTPQGLRDAVRAVRFSGAGDVNISLDETGNGLTSYDVLNLVTVEEDGGVLRSQKVGVWDTAQKAFAFFNKEQIQWKTNHLRAASSTTGQAVYPESVCSQPCPAGHRAVRTQPSCCFYCEACRENERTVMSDNLPKCEKCPTGSNFTWPDDETRTECLPIDPSFLSVTELSGALIFAFDLLVLFLTCSTTVMYIKNGSTRLIKASSKELSLLMLAGQALTCAIVVTFVLEPSDGTCIARDTGFHLSLTLWYGPLLVKTNRVYRIFIAGQRTTKKPPLISPTAQMVVAAVIITPQLLLTCISLAADPPHALTTMPNPSEREVDRECRVPQAPFLVSVAFNLLLMALCAVYAFKTRGLPANFNEARFITFSLYTTVLLCLSFFPTYFTAGKYLVKALSQAAALIFNVLSGQLFLFLPKIYALHFVSEADMNLRDLARSTGSGVTGVRSGSGRGSGVGGGGGGGGGPGGRVAVVSSTGPGVDSSSIR